MSPARLVWIAWPAFLAACALELVVFGFVDPAELEWNGHAIALSRQAVYTAAFFVFWCIALAACWMTTLLRLSPAELNACPFEPALRPAGCPGRDAQASEAA